MNNAQEIRTLENEISRLKRDLRDAEDNARKALNELEGFMREFKRAQGSEEMHNLEDGYPGVKNKLRNLKNAENYLRRIR
jgi:predicted  nucleic acid-binding Zn-ribbon protein